MQKLRRYTTGAGDDPHVGAVAKRFRSPASDGFRAILACSPHIAWNNRQNEKSSRDGERKKDNVKFTGIVIPLHDALRTRQIRR